MPALESWFWDQGAISITLKNETGVPVFESDFPEYFSGEKLNLMALFQGKKNLSGLIAGLDSLGYAGVKHQWIKDVDWERAWLNRYKPLCFGKRIWVVPEKIDFDEENKDVVRLDPGLAFGSGNHESTRMCLEYLDSVCVEGKRILDYGCGSGVLGIAAAIRGAGEVFCFDIDPRALDATNDNAKINSVELSVSEPRDLLGLVDILFANMLAKAIIELKNIFLASLVKDGELILSGLLKDQSEEICSCYEKEARVKQKRELNGWVTLVLQKNAYS